MGNNHLPSTESFKLLVLEIVLLMVVGPPIEIGQAIPQYCRFVSQTTFMFQQHVFLLFFPIIF